MGLAVNIEKTLGDFHLNISFHSDARRIGILGPSGCGKSMTLKSIAGIEQPDRGRIEIGRVLFDSDQRINLKPQKRNVGYMFQNYALFPTMTVAQNIAAGLKLPRGQREARVQEMIDRFHLQGLENHLPGQLSGGQQQRVALARIMAYQPDLILLDEPFSALDQHLKERLQHEMMDMLRDYPGQVIMVSHSRDELYRFAEELLIMEDGALLARGETRALFDDPGTVAVARMTGCKNFSAAQPLDGHTLRLLDWGLDLRLAREVPPDVTAIGYRAHFFEPVWGARRENCIPFRLSGVDELPFERRYYIFPAGQGVPGAVTPGAEMRESAERKSESSATPGAEAWASAAEKPESSVKPGAEAWASAEKRSEPSAVQSPVVQDLGNNDAASNEAPRGAQYHPANFTQDELICWFVQDNERRALDDRSAPDFLQLREEAVMLLRG